MGAIPVVMGTPLPVQLFVLPPADVVRTLEPSLGHSSASAEPGRVTRLCRSGAVWFSILMRGSDGAGKGAHSGGRGRETIHEESKTQEWGS